MNVLTQHFEELFFRWIKKRPGPHENLKALPPEYWQERESLGRECLAFALETIPGEDS